MRVFDRDRFVVFSISLTLFMLQVLYTRIFSVAFWYHHVAFVVSLSLLGLGAGGMFYLLFRERLGAGVLRWLTPLLPATILFGLEFVTNTPLNQVQPFRDAYMNWALYCLPISLTYVIGGMCLTNIYSKKPDGIGPLYAADMAGACLACVAVVLALPVLGGENAVAFTSMIACAPALAVFQGSRKVMCIFAAFMIVTAFLMGSGGFGLQHLKVPIGKETLLDTRWNVFSRVDLTTKGYVFWSPADGYRDLNDNIPSFGLRIDDASRSTILRNVSDLSFFEYDLPYVGYNLGGGKRTALVIGSGGGVDVLAASHFNYTDITAVEINPVIVDYVREMNPAIYDNPKVTLEVDNGRSFIMRTPRKFDLIGLTFVTTYAAMNSGSYSLSENFVYTAEAMADYLDHLTPGGVVSISRTSSLGGAFNERSRHLRIIVETLGGRDIEHPEANVIIVNHGGADTILVKGEPFTKDELEELEARAGRLGFNVTAGDDISKELANLDPYLPTDDSPFFFNSWIGDRLLLSLLKASTLLFTLSILAPLILKRGLRVVENARFILYFLTIGAGYMLLEIPLVQRFSLLLGSPTLSFTVILFTLLASTGLGSLKSEKMEGRAGRVFASLVALITLYCLFLPWVVRELSILPLPGRILATATLLSPLGFLLGFFFPAGIRRAGGKTDLVAWMWGVNATASVIGANAAPYIAIQHGFTSVMALAIPVYTIAYLMLGRKTLL
ncbi:MAG: hypothetical protein V1744_00905 [Candidatus Altiarchaeota archaeon]